MIIERLGDKREYVNIRDYKTILNEPGVYVLIYVENGKPKPFTRLNSTDHEGILLIGKSVHLRNRVRDFYKDILSEGLKDKYHSEGWNFRAYFRDNPNPYAIKLKPEYIWVHWTIMESEKEADQLETQLIQDYVTKFQDKPPLNINIKRQRERSPRNRIRKKETAPKRQRRGPSEQVVLALMRTLPKPITSTVLRDHFGLNKETGRDTIRRIMRGLAEAGKVRIIMTGGEGERKQYNYELV